MKIRTILFASAIAPFLVPCASRADDVNEANNPLTPKITINLQDYYTPSFYGLPDRQSNSFLFRGLIPAKLGGMPQLFRFTLPISSVPAFPHGTTTGLGDLTLMDMFIFPGKSVSFAAGPILVAPTATDDATGSGRWQAGAVGAVIAPQSWGLLGLLATYQHSFAKSFGRDPQSLMTVQPIVNVNLPDQFYLRSSATWNFDFEKDSGYIPIGLGLGKVVQLNATTTMNAYIEPQFTAYHYGKGVPHWQIFAGVNLQFALGSASKNMPEQGH